MIVGGARGLPWSLSLCSCVLLCVTVCYCVTVCTRGLPWSLSLCWGERAVMHAVKLPYQKYRHMLQSTARHSLWQEQGQATQAARFTRFTRKGLQSKRFCYEHTGSKDRASALVGEHQRKTLWSRQNSIKRKG